MLHPEQIMPAPQKEVDVHRMATHSLCGLVEYSGWRMSSLDVAPGHVGRNRTR